MLSVYFYSNLTSKSVDFTHSTGMAPNVTLSTFQNVSETISADQPPARFNIAVLLDFDTRAHPLRYLLTYLHKKIPQPVEQYSDLEALYVFAPDGYPIDKPLVWELKTYLPYQINELAFVSPGYKLYKLSK